MPWNYVTTYCAICDQDLPTWLMTVFVNAGSANRLDRLPRSVQHLFSHSILFQFGSKCLIWCVTTWILLRVFIIIDQYYVDPTSHVAYYGHMFLRVKVLDCDIVAFWHIYGYLILSK